VPRVERARDFWSGRLRTDINNSNWESIQRELDPGKSKKDKGGALTKMTPPMRLWASSFSGKTLSDKTLAMQAAVDELSEAISSLEVAANGKEKGGFFGFLGGNKTMADSQRVELAKAAYKKGVLAFNKFIEIGNDGNSVSFAPIDTID
jgi:hypothetical protein